MRLGIDLMGSDHPPQTIVQAVLTARLSLDPSCSIVAIVQEKYYEALKKEHPSISFVSALEAIEMDESPLIAVRKKRNSSMAVGMRLLREKKIDAFLTAGNTGALVATARVHLPKLPTIRAPALCVVIPREREGIAVLDVGANISFKPEHLIDYAKMAIVYKSLNNNKKPKIALLNIGIEEQKGTKDVQVGFQLLIDYFKAIKEADFLGNVEAREVFQKDIDILLTDGFTGNIFLKTCEGVSSFLIDYLKRSSGHSDLLTKFQTKFNYSAHPGAILLGVDGLVMKCHGYSDMASWISCIKGAFNLVHLQFIEKMKERLTQ